MSDPVLHVVAGPNGAGKSAFCEKVLQPATHLEFVNADQIAARRWPDDPVSMSYEAAAIAAQRRAEMLDARVSFATETVFSHESKLDLVRAAIDTGYLVTLHVLLVPEGLAVARVAHRVLYGGHPVPENKIRERYRRMWPLVASAIQMVEAAVVYDNSRGDQPFRIVATFQYGFVVGTADWPSWAPKELRLPGHH